MKNIGLKRLSREELDGFPYLSATEDYDGNKPIAYMARSVSLCLDFSSLVPATEYFPFPIVSIPEEHPLFPKRLFDKQRGFMTVHEVQHVQSMLEYTERSPDYFDLLETVSLMVVSSVKDLEASMRFEINKMLFLEPPALDAEYRAGGTAILVPYFIAISEYQCTTIEEFRWFHLCEGLNNLLNAYRDRFPGEAPVVESTFRRLVSEICTGIIGKNPFEYVVACEEMLFARMRLPGYKDAHPDMPPGRGQPGKSKHYLVGTVRC